MVAISFWVTGFPRPLRFLAHFQATFRNISRSSGCIRHCNTQYSRVKSPCTEELQERNCQISRLCRYHPQIEEHTYTGEVVTPAFAASHSCSDVFHLSIWEGKPKIAFTAAALLGTEQQCMTNPVTSSRDPRLLHRIRVAVPFSILKALEHFDDPGFSQSAAAGVGRSDSLHSSRSSASAITRPREASLLITA